MWVLEGQYYAKGGIKEPDYYHGQFVYSVREGNPKKASDLGDLHSGSFNEAEMIKFETREEAVKFRNSYGMLLLCYLPIEYIDGVRRVPEDLKE